MDGVGIGGSSIFGSLEIEDIPDPLISEPRPAPVTATEKDASDVIEF